MPIPSAISGQKYISLATFRRNGVPVYNPVWFAEENGRLYVMTELKTGKAKRLRNNARVKIAPCTIRGKITGPEFSATARLLPPSDFKHARELINHKYWLARVTMLFSKVDAYIEITPDSA